MKFELDQVNDLFRRMEKMSIKIEGTRNFPWIYLTKVNGNIVKEKLMSDWGFTICLVPWQIDAKYCKLLDIKETFKIIRKYR